MGLVRIDETLHKKLVEWIRKNGNKYRFPSVTSFVNSAIYEKLKKLEKEIENDKNE